MKKSRHGVSQNQGWVDPNAAKSSPVGATRVNAWSLLPRTAAARQQLRARAELLARQGVQEQHILEQFVCFRLGASEMYGVAYGYLEEIAYFPDITRVPCTPPAIAGVANYRGELLTVLDLKHFFNIEAGGGDDAAPVLVARSGGTSVGLLVDEIEGNGAFAAANLAPALPSAGVSNLDYVQGIHEGRVAILNIAAMLADLNLCVDETVK